MNRKIVQTLRSFCLATLIITANCSANEPAADAKAEAKTEAAKPEDQGEFGAHGSGVVRVELEAKLKVPLEKTDMVWQWLQKRYADCAWLDRDGHKFTVALGDEDFVDVYFDTPDLRLLSQQSGVRHRSRVVHWGSAARKDGRQLLQIKLNRNDGAGLGRSEIKFTAFPQPIGSNSIDESHPMLGLVVRDELELCKKQFQELDLDPYSMLPVVKIEQNRRRVYISDQWGAFMTLTLDLCTCTSWGANLKWTEIELELNEIRYTEASAEQRQEMESYIGIVQADLQKEFPDIVQDQTPKYNKAFTAVEQSVRVPLRSLVGAGIDEKEFRNGLQFGAIGLVGIIVCGLLWLFRGRWMARQDSNEVPTSRAPRQPAVTASAP